MTTLKELHEVVSQCGNVLRGIVEVGGKEFCIECNMDKNHIQIIDESSSCETGEIDAEGDVILQGGECVTANWASSDWSDLTAFVGAKSNLSKTKFKRANDGVGYVESGPVALKPQTIGRGAGRPPIAGETATHHIHLRVTKQRKNCWVGAAHPKTLAQWMTENLDKASHYESLEQ